MKKILCVILALTLILSVCACGGQKEDKGEIKDTEPQTSGDSLDAIGDVSVDQGLFNVEIIVPSDFLDEGTTQEELDQIAKENGYKSITLNEDGSATYIMTKAQHKEMMSGIAQGIEESLAEMVGSDEYPSIVEIKTNDDYSQYIVVLNTDEVGFAESFTVLGFYMFTGMYHVFNGTEVDNINVQFVNEATGEVIQESNSRDLADS